MTKLQFEMRCERIIKSSQQKTSTESAYNMTLSTTTKSEKIKIL